MKKSPEYISEKIIAALLRKNELVIYSRLPIADDLVKKQEPPTLLRRIMRGLFLIAVMYFLYDMASTGPGESTMSFEQGMFVMAIVLILLPFTTYVIEKFISRPVSGNLIITDQRIILAGDKIGLEYEMETKSFEKADIVRIYEDFGAGSWVLKLVHKDRKKPIIFALYETKRIAETLNENWGLSRDFPAITIR